MNFTLHIQKIPGKLIMTIIIMIITIIIIIIIIIIIHSFISRIIILPCSTDIPLSS